MVSRNIRERADDGLRGASKSRNGKIRTEVVRSDNDITIQCTMKYKTRDGRCQGPSGRWASRSFEGQKWQDKDRSSEI